MALLRRIENLDFGHTIYKKETNILAPFGHLLKLEFV
jgi:hypothetical protein